MKRLATLETWARRLATREGLDGKSGEALSPKQRVRRTVLALCEAYVTGANDAAKDAHKAVAQRRARA